MCENSRAAAQAGGTPRPGARKGWAPSDSLARFPRRRWPILPEGVSTRRSRQLTAALLLALALAEVVIVLGAGVCNPTSAAGYAHLAAGAAPGYG
jgi:hypothetical protein